MTVGEPARALNVPREFVYRGKNKLALTNELVLPNVSA
jgi:hypothetical protein